MRTDGSAGPVDRAAEAPVATPRAARARAWPLPIGYLAFVAGLCAAVATTRERGPEEVRAIIRLTAFTSAVPFLFAFTASALHRLRRSDTTRWLLANRRYLGLSVAASHWWHLVAIVTLVRRYGSTGEPIPTPTLVFGGAGFAFLGLMAATSNDASQRALGRGWGWLHLAGAYVVWIDFIFTYSGAATVAPFHAVMTLLFTAAWMLRVAAFFASRPA